MEKDKDEEILVSNRKLRYVFPNIPSLNLSVSSVHLKALNNCLANTGSISFTELSMEANNNELLKKAFGFGTRIDDKLIEILDFLISKAINENNLKYYILDGENYSRAKSVYQYFLNEDLKPENIEETYIYHLLLIGLDILDPPLLPYQLINEIALLPIESDEATRMFRRTIFNLEKSRRIFLSKICLFVISYEDIIDEICSNISSHLFNYSTDHYINESYMVIRYFMEKSEILFNLDMEGENFAISNDISYLDTIAGDIFYERLYYFGSSLDEARVFCSTFYTFLSSDLIITKLDSTFNYLKNSDPLNEQIIWKKKRFESVIIFCLTYSGKILCEENGFKEKINTYFSIMEKMAIIEISRLIGNHDVSARPSASLFLPNMSLKASVLRSTTTSYMSNTSKCSKLLSTSPVNFAEQLIYNDFLSFSSVVLSRKESPTSDNHSKHSDAISKFVIKSIITSSSKTAKKNIEFFIKVAAVCMSYRSYNTANSIIIALEHPSVSTLPIFKKIKRKRETCFRIISDTFSTTSNYVRYRKKLSVSKPPISPLFFLIKRDITAILESQGLIKDEKHISLNTLKILSPLVRLVAKLQERPYKILPDPQLQKELMLSLKDVEGFQSGFDNIIYEDFSKSTPIESTPDENLTPGELKSIRSLSANSETSIDPAPSDEIVDPEMVDLLKQQSYGIP